MGEVLRSGSGGCIRWGTFCDLVVGVVLDGGHSEIGEWGLYKMVDVLRSKSRGGIR